MSSSSIDLKALVEFLDQYAWVYSFRWIDPHLCDQPIYSIHAAVDHIPTLWLEPLKNATLSNLKALVSGEDDNYPWPQELQNFASECRRLTNFLSCNVCLDPSWLPHSNIAFNPVSNCMDFFPLSDIPLVHTKLYMTPKKIHEVSRMTEFLRRITQPPNPYELGDDHQEENTDSTALAKFQSPPLFEQVDAQLHSAPLYLVDIGSGLGHFANSVAFSVRNSDKTFLMDSLFRVYAVDCDVKLHRKARYLLNTTNHMALDSTLVSPVQRILFRLTDYNTKEFQEDLRKIFSKELRTSDSSSNRQYPTYLLSGLHCCGDLSQSVIRLFENDDLAEWLLLVGCCYHKMAVNQFPTSHKLQSAFATIPRLATSFCCEATFRLACQWSPSTWMGWTQRDSNAHRLRLISRLLITLKKYGGHQTNLRWLDPIKASANLSAQLDTIHTMQFTEIVSLLNEPLTSLTCDSWMTKLETIWFLTPGLLALQQLLQPLLEIVVLADRVWRLREAKLFSVEFAGLVRLFDPKLSPRCLAIVAHKHKC